MLNLVPYGILVFVFFVTGFLVSVTCRGYITAPTMSLFYIVFLFQDEILSTAYLVAHYLKGIGFRKKVYLIGTNGIGEELKAVGIRHTGIGVCIKLI